MIYAVPDICTSIRGLQMFQLAFVFGLLPVASSRPFFLLAPIHTLDVAMAGKLMMAQAQDVGTLRS